MPTLQWLDDEQARRAVEKVPYRMLQPDDTLSCGERDAGNMLIQGDNLDALKALMPYVAGCVKCIFIDPPYNTGSAFEHYDDNVEHSTWLSLMYPRLELLRDLLAENGSIWVTIDDSEAHYLKVIMDEVFGRKNFVANVVWQKNFAPKSSARHLSSNHDHVLMYAKDSSGWQRNLLPRGEAQNSRYKNPDNDPRGPWTSDNLTARNYYSRGSYSVTSPSGKKWSGPPKGTYWRFSPEKFKELDESNSIWWGSDGNNMPRLKRFLSDVQDGIVPQTIWFQNEVGNTQEAKKELLDYEREGTPVFQTIKPERLIQRVLQIATDPGDLVLDSFLGSGTTAAVAHKMGRRWIGIEMGDHAVTHCAPRLKKVVGGEQGGISKAVGWKGGGGFRFYRLGEAVFDAYGVINPKVTFEALAAHIWFAETGTPTPRDPGKSPLLGVHNGTAYYLLYNGILGDKRIAGGNVLNSAIYAELPPFDGPKVIYGEWCPWSEKRLKEEQVTFKQTPYDIRVR